MELTKLTTNYKVKEVSTNLSFEGEALFGGDNVIQSLSGVIKTIEESPLSPLSAYVHHSFNGEMNNQSISNLNEEFRVEAATLIDTIIKTIKATIVE